MKLQFYLYHADSLFNVDEHAQAETIYRQILHLKKYMHKTKSTPKQPEFPNDIISDVEVKYKIHLCCMKQNLKHSAVEVLESIQARLRTPKVNMALGNLYLESGFERSAITAFKEVLREAPLSLDAAENLLKLGVQVTYRCSFLFASHVYVVLLGSRGEFNDAGSSKRHYLFKHVVTGTSRVTFQRLRHCHFDLQEFGCTRSVKKQQHAFGEHCVLL